MQLLTKSILTKLRANRDAQKHAPAGVEIDHKPVVKFFTPDGGATWLITEMYEDGDTLFGLCDLGLGCVELGYVSLVELTTLRGKMGLPVERDRFFKADKTIGEYAILGRADGRIAA